METITLTGGSLSQLKREIEGTVIDNATLDNPISQSRASSSNVFLINGIYDRLETDSAVTVINIPDHSILKFEGGLIRGVELRANNCSIQSPLVKVFDNVTFSGDFVEHTMFHIEWFVEEYEESLIVDTTKNAAPEIEQALNSGIKKIFFSNDRYYPVRHKVDGRVPIEVTAIIDIYGEKHHINKVRNWFLNEPCIYCLDGGTIMRYSFSPGSNGREDASQVSNPKYSLCIEGLNLCSKSNGNRGDSTPVIEINYYGRVVLWGLYLNLNIIVAKESTDNLNNTHYFEHIDYDYTYTGLKIRANNSSIALCEIHGSVTSAYKAYDIAKGPNAPENAYINDIKIWADTACAMGGTFTGGFPVINYGSHQMRHYFEDFNIQSVCPNEYAYFEAKAFYNYGYIWDAALPKEGEGNYSGFYFWTCKYTVKPAEGFPGFMPDWSQKMHSEVSVAEPTDAFYPNLLADDAVKYSGIGITSNVSVRAYVENEGRSSRQYVQAGTNLLEFKRYIFPSRLCRSDGTRHTSSIHSDTSFSYNPQQSDYKYEYEVMLTFNKENYNFAQYQDNPPLYICPSRAHQHFEIVVKYYISQQTTDPVKTVTITEDKYSPYLYGKYIRISEIFLSNQLYAYTTVEYRQDIETDTHIITRPMFFMPNYHATHIIRSGNYQNMCNLPRMISEDLGEMFYHATHGQLWWNGCCWVERDGAKAGVARSGPFSEKPDASDIYIGFPYFCTTGAIVAGYPMANIIIYFAGNSGWVDSWGRMISSNA